MFVEKNPLDKPSHQNHFVSVAEAGKRLAPILVVLASFSYILGCLIVLAIVYIVEPDLFGAVAALVGLVTLILAGLLFACLSYLKRKHSDKLRSYGIGK